MAGHGLCYRVGRAQAAVSVVCVAAAAIIFSAVIARAQQAEKESFGEAAVGTTLKVMAKAYVTTMDLKKLKKRHTERIEKMDEQSFQAAYNNTLTIVRYSPKLRSDFGLADDLGREEALERLRKLDKKTLCRMIDAVPDKVLIAKFKAFSSRHSDELAGKDTAAQLQAGWKSFTTRLEK